MCPVQGPDIDESGTPCIDWTANGARSGLEGDTLVVFLAYAKFHVWWGTKLVVHENVPGFLVWMARVHLSTFNVHPFTIRPKDSGFPLVERTRQYLLCTNFITARLHHDPYELFEYVTQRLQTNLTPADAVFAEPLEIRAEEEEVCSMRGIALRPFCLPQDLCYTLSEAETRYVNALDVLYMVKTGQRPESNKALVYSLTDNPVNRVSWTLTSNAIPTLRRNSGRLYFPSLKRCMTRSERLALMGFPSHPELSQACGGDVPAMTRRQHNFLLGNSMHMPTATLILTVGLACVRPN